MTFKNFEDAQNYILDHIPNENFQFQGESGFLRSKKFLEKLGNPQNDSKTIHVAGTSGKGSTTYLTSKILVSQRKKVGMFISPHIIDIRERIQLNNEFISKDAFLKTLNKIHPKIKEFEEKEGMVTFFEILAGLAFEYFRNEKVDYAVIETGLGGLLDTSNTIENPNKINIITQIGFDHTNILGNTIKEIASQKAGIIKHGSITLIPNQSFKNATEVIKMKAELEDSEFYIVERSKNIKTNENGTTFDFRFKEYEFSNLETSIIGEYQAENLSLATAANLIAGKRDGWKFNEENFRKALTTMSFPGRFEIRNISSSQVILDGAHNIQKMQTFLNSLTKVFPDQKFSFIVGFKKDKDIENMLKLIIPYAKKIICTEFKTLNQDLGHNSINMKEIRDTLKSLEFENIINISSNEEVLDLIRKNEDTYVITGSLYLISNFYKEL